jgi:hypothetical protein
MGLMQPDSIISSTMSDSKPSPNTPSNKSDLSANNALPAQSSSSLHHSSYIDLQYSWCFGSQPIWLNPSFMDLFFDSVLNDLLNNSAEPNSPIKRKAFNTQQWCQSLELVQLVYSNILSNSPHWLKSLSSEELTNFTLILPTLAETKMYCSKANYVGSKNDERIYDAIKEIHSRLVLLAMNAFMIIPGGWINDKGDGNNVLYLIQRSASGYMFAVVNTSNEMSEGSRGWNNSAVILILVISFRLIALLR